MGGDSQNEISQIKTHHFSTKIGSSDKIDLQYVECKNKVWMVDHHILQWCKMQWKYIIYQLKAEIKRLTLLQADVFHL